MVSMMVMFMMCNDLRADSFMTFLDGFDDFLRPIFFYFISTSSILHITLVSPLRISIHCSEPRRPRRGGGLLNSTFRLLDNEKVGGNLQLLGAGRISEASGGWPGMSMEEPGDRTHAHEHPSI